MLRSLFVIFALLGALASPAAAEDIPRSECLAMANAPALMTPVSLRRVAAQADEVGITAKPDEVAITYAGHSTYFIDTPGGCGSRPTIAAPTRSAACPKSSP